MAVSFPRLSVAKASKLTTPSTDGIRALRFELLVFNRLSKTVSRKSVVPLVDSYGVLSFTLPGVRSHSYRLEAILGASSKTKCPIRRTLIKNEWVEENVNNWTLIERIGGFEFYDVPLTIAGSISEAEMTLKRSMTNPEDQSYRFDLDYPTLAALLRMPQGAQQQRQHQYQADKS